MQDGYVQAMAKSFSNQENRFLIPESRLGSPFSIKLGFQPLGLASVKLDPERTRVAIADYFMPAVALLDITRDEKGFTVQTNWIRGVDYQGQSVRLFPDVFASSGANRVQGVNFGPEGALVVTRNADREFYLLLPPATMDGRWILDDSRRLPGEEMLHSFLIHIEKGKLATIESSYDLQKWTMREYLWDDLTFTGAEQTIAPYTYGIAHERDAIWTVADYRSREWNALGVYEDFNLACPGIYGNGLCFLSDGSLLVSRHGLSRPEPFGVPGELIIVPKELLL